MSITAQHTAPVTAAERNQIAMLLIQQYPCLSGSFGSGHVSVKMLNSNFMIGKIIQSKRFNSKAKRC